MVLLAGGPYVNADEADRDGLRKELAELKTMAKELQTRIAAIEKKLKPKSEGREPRIHDIVIVEVAVNEQGKELPTTAGQPTDKASLNRHFLATIEDIQPNGDLVLSGHRDITHKQIRYSETISGVVPRDCVDASRRVPVAAVRDLTMSRRAVGLGK
ncbi:flagellar basal body L-ring protein FlgH [Aeoliella sp. SH292]|uniref:flagellar basal body L-ring protein FlgH n=1 Tax=Aeoliella sp. SH292 TaxID=3454464 RepID=UPI003F992AEC